MIRRRHAVALLTVLFCAPLGRAAEGEPYLPEDTEVVVNLNVRQILDSELVKKNLLEMAQEALRGQDEVQDVLKDLGFDPFKDLDRLIVASPAGNDRDRGLIIAHGRFDVDKFKAKAEAVAKDDDTHLKIRKVLGGKHLLYEVNLPDRNEPLFVALAGRDTILASLGKDYVVDALKKVGKKDKAALKNKQFQTLLDKLDARQSLSMAAVKTPELAKTFDKAPGDIKDMLTKIQALGGGVTISDEVKLELVVNVENVKDAKDLRDSAKAGLDLVVGFLSAFAQAQATPGAELVVDFLKTLTIKNVESTVVLKGRISSDAIEDIIKKGK